MLKIFNVLGTAAIGDASPYCECTLARLNVLFVV